MTDEKKIDESWKQQAKGSEAPAPRAPGPPSSAPPADFSSLVASLATGALMALGGEPDEKGRPSPPDLDRARYAIDLLDVLAVKTKGNLAPDEERNLTAILHRLRLAFVEASRSPRP
jgi:hypothetical protein